MSGWRAAKQSSRLRLQAMPVATKSLGVRPDARCPPPGLTRINAAWSQRLRMQASTASRSAARETGFRLRPSDMITRRQFGTASMAVRAPALVHGCAEQPRLRRRARGPGQVFRERRGTAGRRPVWRVVRQSLAAGLAGQPDVVIRFGRGPRRCHRRCGGRCRRCRSRHIAA